MTGTPDAFPTSCQGPVKDGVCAKHRAEDQPCADCGGDGNAGPAFSDDYMRDCYHVSMLQPGGWGRHHDGGTCAAGVWTGHDVVT